MKGAYIMANFNNQQMGLQQNGFIRDEIIYITNKIFTHLTNV